MHQIVDRQHQFTSRVRSLFSRGQINWLGHHIGVTHGQSQLLVVVAKATQQLADFLHEFFCVRDAFQSGGSGHFAGLDTLEQATFKSRATFGPVGVNPAERSVETAARLDEYTFLPLLPEQQAEFLQPPVVITPLQFHVGEQHAIAAQPAIRTKLFNGVHSKNCSSRLESAPIVCQIKTSGLTSAATKLIVISRNVSDTGAAIPI